MPMLTPPKKLSASELSGVETWQGVLKEAIEYLKDLGDEIRNLSEATKDIWEIHFLICQFGDRVDEIRSRIRRLYHHLAHYFLSTGGDIPKSEVATTLEKILADINELHKDWMKFLEENKLGVIFL
jgi:hypothetical protein